MVEQFLCLISFSLHLKIIPRFPKFHGVIEADLGFFGSGLLADAVWKANSTKVSFFGVKQNLCNDLKRDRSIVCCLEGTSETWQVC